MHLDAEVFRLWASGMIDVCNHDRECRCKYDVYIVERCYLLLSRFNFIDLEIVE